LNLKAMFEAEAASTRENATRSKQAASTNERRLTISCAVFVFIYVASAPGPLSAAAAWSG
jgi:hypothetical protein